MYAMKSLASGRFDRAVAFYGMVRVPDHWRGRGQRDAIDAVTARGEAELLCIFGTGDPYCPEEQMDEVEAAGAEVVRYEGAGHGWAHDPSRPTYRTDDAADAWSRALSFLAGTP
jgi:carboxymethylenebutenolidase